MTVKENMYLADLENDLDQVDEVGEELTEAPLRRQPKGPTVEEFEALQAKVDKLYSALMLLKDKKLDAVKVWFHVDKNREGRMPVKANPTDAGFDLYAAEDYIVHTHITTPISTGVYMEVPTGYEVQIRPRSGLAFKHTVSITNAPGTVDAGYTGEVKVGLISLSSSSFVVKKGDRIAQAVYMKLPEVEAFESPFETVEAFQQHFRSARGSNGFGSTGA